MPRAGWVASNRGFESSAEKQQAVHSRWAVLNARLSDEITALVKASAMSDKEKAAWVPYSEWCAVEERIVREEFGSQRHLLVALSWHLKRHKTWRHNGTRSICRHRCEPSSRHR
jgi:hypothetical protein